MNKQWKLLIGLLLLFHGRSIALNIILTQPIENNLASSDEPLNEWIEHKIDSVMNLHHIPAVSVGIIKDGKVFMTQGFGVQNRKEGEEVTENALYQIASDTKKMTGIIAKKLAQEGLINLDKSIVHYLGDAINQDARKKLEHVTPKLLLLHQSGLPYREPTMKRIDGEPMLVPYTEEDLLKDLNNVQLESKPGTTFRYSNFGYAVMGYLCERTSGRTYAELIKTYISLPLAMPNTTTELTRAQKLELVTPYLPRDRYTSTQPFIMGKLSAAGGVYSNVLDLSQLMLYQMNAYAVYAQGQPADSTVLLTLHLGPEEDGYGFGLSKKTFENGTQYGHGGDLDGYASGYIFSPEYQAGVIILTSSGGKWVGELEKELFYKLTNRMYAPPKKSIAKELYTVISGRGSKAGKKWIKQHAGKTEYYIDEAEINELGYAFLGQNQLKTAQMIFKWNVKLFPNSPNVYDSLAETYLKQHNTRKAIKYYKKSLALDPKNENAARILKSLE